MRRPSLLAGLLVLLSGPARAEESLTVAAASSLTDVLPPIAALWKQADGIKVTFQFDASSRLAQQVDQGAPIDAFFSADAEWMDFLEQHGRLEPRTREDLLGNELVVVVPSSAKPLANITDLTKFPRLALAGENVPAGRYARTALRHEKVWDQLDDRVINAANVRAALTLVASGDVPAAVVYKTDALAEKRVRIAYTFPATAHPRIVYPSAAVKNSAHVEAARRFLEFCHSTAAARIFTAAGFTLAGGR
jgi:molybdate transport system substrate-binding protein